MKKRLFGIILTVCIIFQTGVTSFANESNVSNKSVQDVAVKVDTNTQPVLGGEKITLTEGNFKLVETDKIAGGLTDSYNNVQIIENKGVHQDTEGNSKNMQLITEISSINAYSKDDYYTFEFWNKNPNGTMSYFGNAEFRSVGYKLMRYRVNLEKDDFKDQKYIYVRLGVARTSTAQYFSDVECYKVLNPFADISDWDTHWAQNEIRYAMDKGWIQKTNSFRPNDAITRAEFIKIVNKAFGYTSKGSVPFTDVKSNQWYYNEVAIALKNGVISNKNKTFRPNDPISREEVAVILTNIKKNKDSKIDKLNKYSDKGQVSEWALTSVEGAIEAGYMGQNTTKFRPKENITRAEGVATLYRVAK